jgi:hypothetical protein
MNVLSMFSVPGFPGQARIFCRGLHRLLAFLDIQVYIQAYIRVCNRVCIKVEMVV